ncbi:hypothetical protein ACAG39_11200 [Caldicellulosiruptoraceae bacterium PP1]
MKKKLIRALSTMLVFSFLTTVVFANTNIKKDETVYAILDPDGNAKECIVTDWIHSDLPNITIDDKSNLTNIVNLKGEQNPIIDGQNLKWNLEGNDLFYQGNAPLNLPFSIKVRYFLDGKEISYKELLGKSGHLKITINVINNLKKDVLIKNERRTIYIPFSVACLLNMPVDKFKNVKSNFGQLISDGNNQAVASVLFPGLKESLSLSDEFNKIIDLPNSISIESDVKDFELGSIYFTVVNKVPTLDNLKTDSLDEFKKGIEDLKDASNKLAEGSVTLSNGQKEFNLNLSKFVDGLNKLTAASKELKDGTTNLSKGIDEANKGALQLKNGIDELKTNSPKLIGGIKDYTDGVYKFVYGSQTLNDSTSKLLDGVNILGQKQNELTQGLKQSLDATTAIKNGHSQLNEGVANLDSGIEQILNGKKKELEGINLLISGIDTIQKMIEPLKNVQLIADAMNKLDAALQKEKEGLQNLVVSSNAMIEGLNKLSLGAKQVKEGSEKINTSLSQLENGNKKLYEGSLAISQNMNLISENVSKIEQGQKQLNENGKKLIAGGNLINSNISSLGNGFDKLSQGANKLSNGMQQLNNGFMQYKNGFEKFYENLNLLNDKSKLLLDGSKKLTEGSKTLSDNIEKFNKEGIDELYKKSQELTVGLDKVKILKDELIKFSNEYKTYTGISDGMNGEVKFVIKTEELKKEEKATNEKPQATQEKKLTFWQWLKKLLHIGA